MVEINFKCENCDFSFMDKNLIFYLNTNLEDLESILNFHSNENKENNKNIDNNKNDNKNDDKNDDNNENNHLELIETILNKENSDKMSKSMISGFLYENYCPNCKKLIKTYVPENNKLFTQEEIERILTKEISKNLKIEEKTFKILFFDFENTFYKDRRNVLENSECPNCNSEMSLVISEKVPCPICGGQLKEEF